MTRIAVGIGEPDDDRGKPRGFHNGCTASYIHAGGKIGVLIEVDCESEFLAKSDEFRSLMKDVAMHIAALDPKYISRQDVPREVSLKQEEQLRQEAKEIGKEMDVFFAMVCLSDQPFVKDPVVTVGQMIATKSDEWGERVSVRRFVRFRVAEAATIAVHRW